MRKVKKYFQQTFNIYNKEITGTIENDNDTTFVVLYSGKDELKRKVYTGSLSDYLEMVANIESFIMENYINK
jgi:hypothetical protein